MSTPNPNSNSNPNSIAVKVMKSTGTETSPAQHAKFPMVANDLPGATKIESLHPKVRMEAEAKQQKVKEPVVTEPKAILIPKANGTFEIQVTCSCGEVHTIECETIPEKLEPEPVPEKLAPEKISLS
ncbi:MAG: hypothetical protein V4507_10510 [Verrucomicrobiota bacterium]